MAAGQTLTRWRCQPLAQKPPRLAFRVGLQLAEHCVAQCLVKAARLEAVQPCGMAPGCGGVALRYNHQRPSSTAAAHGRVHPQRLHKQPAPTPARHRTHQPAPAASSNRSPKRLASQGGMVRHGSRGCAAPSLPGTPLPARPPAASEDRPVSRPASPAPSTVSAKDATARDNAKLLPPWSAHPTRRPAASAS